MHRDFKVDNLFMHDDTVIIADLGFAKAGREMTQTQCGTPMYMAPEVFEGKEYTNLADLWSVGVSMYELLFGKFPFNAMSQPALLKNIKDNQGPNLEINRSTNNISNNCEDLLRRILTYDTNTRLSWEEFFNHPLFTPEGKKQQQEAYGSVLDGLKNNQMMVTGMWNSAKVDRRPAEEQQEFKCDLQDIDETMREDTMIFNEMSDNVRLSDIYTHNSQRYEHELNKIRFVFVAVRKLKDLAASIQ
jgi:serine/threonine protein kinase